MRTNTEPTFVETTGVGEVQKATVAASAKLFNFFAKQIYSDMYVAIWRELVANGVDAQKMVNDTTTPVEVTLPSMLEPHASVRDYGCSMDHEFMMNKFMRFTDASTKEHSDDYIGGFGIGSKAPLAYTDQFSIKCWMDGKLRIYSVFKDSDGEPSIAFLSEVDSSEPTGVEVSFPVRQDDIDKFNSVVVSTLEYFDPQPVLKGNSAYEMKPIEYDARGTNWGTRIMSMNQKVNRIIVGGVAYPLDTQKIPYKYQKLREMTRFGLDLYVNIGDVDIALSRESINQDDALYEKLEVITAAIGDEIRDQLSKRFEGFTTRWEAAEALSNTLKDASYDMRRIISDFARFQGKPLSETLKIPKIKREYELADGSTETRKEYMRMDYIAFGTFGYRVYGSDPYDRSISGFKKTQAYSPQFRAIESDCRFRPSSFDAILYVDDDCKDKPLLRVRKYIQDNQNSHFLVLRKREPDLDWKEFFKLIGDPPESMLIKLSTIAPLKTTRKKKGTGKKFKYFNKRERPVNPNQYYGDTPNDSGVLPPGGGMYIPMDNYSPRALTDDVRLVAQANPDMTFVWLNLTDVKASGIENMPEWKTVDDLKAEAIAVYMKENSSNMYLAEAMHELQGRSDSYVASRHIYGLAKLDNFPKRGPLAAWLKLEKELTPFLNSEHSRMRNRCQLNKKRRVAAGNRVQKMWQAVVDKHPLLVQALNDWNLRGPISKHPEILKRLI